MTNLVFLRDRWSSRLRGGHQPFHEDGSRLGTAIEAGATTGAVFAGVLRRVHPVVIKFGRQFKTFRRTRLHTQAASLAFFGIDNYVTARLR
jgi:hypothetical protein